MQCIPPSLMAHCQSLPKNASGSIQAQHKTQNQAKVMGAHSGLSTCGPWCGERNGQHQVRWIMTVSFSFSLSVSFSYSVCLTLLNCRALFLALYLSFFLAVSLTLSLTLSLSLDITDVFLLYWAGSLDEARDGTQKNTQGVWPCKLPVDGLPLQQLASSPALMSCFS